jgi:GPH family glycoside/pentoside/hexuronide:cation symporter
MWLVPPWGTLALTVYYTVVFILFDTIFTAVHVGYNALTPEMTPDYDERSSLNGYRMVFSIAGTLGAIILATVVGWYITDSQALFAVVGIALGLASIIPPLIVFGVTREKPADKLPEPMPVLEALKATFTNRPFWLVMGLYLLSWTAASVLAAVLIYYANYYLRLPDQANYFILVAQGAAILFIPLMVWLARRLDKRRAFILGSAAWIVVLVVLFGMQPRQVTLVYVLAALSGAGIATAYVIPWSMVPDIIEYDQVGTGERREGSYYSFASLFQKIATGVTIWALGQALALSGYITPTAGGPLPEQPPEVLMAIRVFVSPVPIVLLVLAILCAWRYPITRERHRALRDELAAREV